MLIDEIYCSYNLYTLVICMANECSSPVVSSSLCQNNVLSVNGNGAIPFEHVH